MLDAIRVPWLAAASRAPMNATSVPFAGRTCASPGSAVCCRNRPEYGIGVLFRAMKYTMPPETSAIPSPALYRVASRDPTECPRRTRSRTSAELHIFTIPPRPPPAALKSTWRTGFPKCPEPSDIARPVAASNITTRPSWAAIARNVPPGCHATSFSVAPYTYGGRRRAPAADHSRSSPFADVVAIVFVEDHATPVTGAGWTRGG